MRVAPDTPRPWWRETAGGYASGEPEGAGPELPPAPSVGGGVVLLTGVRLAPLFARARGAEALAAGVFGAAAWGAAGFGEAAWAAAAWGAAAWATATVGAAAGTSARFADLLEAFPPRISAMAASMRCRRHRARSSLRSLLRSSRATSASRRSNLRRRRRRSLRRANAVSLPVRLAVGARFLAIGIPFAIVRSRWTSAGSIACASVGWEA
jgi:hypothetical protein